MSHSPHSNGFHKRVQWIPFRIYGFLFLILQITIKLDKSPRVEYEVYSNLNFSFCHESFIRIRIRWVGMGNHKSTGSVGGFNSKYYPTFILFRIETLSTPSFLRRCTTSSFMEYVQLLMRNGIGFNIRK